MLFSENDKINYLNIFLMLLSTVMAFVLPFELFLFSYAVLGPLHYLTEISWLHKSSFYVKSKFDPLILVFFGLLATLAFFNPKIAAKGLGEHMVYMSFFAALFMVIIKDTWLKIGAILSSILIVLLVKDELFYKIFFGVFLPTLIHVFIFTGLFIIYGALKTKSISGYLSMAFFLLCGSSFMWLGADWTSFLTEKGKKIYELFLPVNDIMLKTFGVDGLSFQSQVTKEYLFNQPSAVMLMRFIAFAYTYHYLNWFSKTSVIKWHEIPKARMTAIIIIWIISVALYVNNYKHGLKLLYFLSMVHVFLEFPLNFRSISGITEEIGKRVGLKTKTSA